MAQNDFVIADQTASAALADINSALQSLASCSSGATQPSVRYANQLWYDTSTHILKVRNEANSAWINILYVHQADGAVHIIDNTYISDTSGNHVGLLGDQATSEWTTGTGTTESLVSPAKIKAAIDALASVTSSEVLGYIAASSAGAVGTYAFAVYGGTIGTGYIYHDAGATIAGSNLRFSGAVGNGSSGAALSTTSRGSLSSAVGAYYLPLSGTWRCMGHTFSRRLNSETYPRGMTLWLRIS